MEVPLDYQECLVLKELPVKMECPVTKEHKVRPVLLELLVSQVRTAQMELTAVTEILEQRENKEKMEPQVNLELMALTV